MPQQTYYPYTSSKSGKRYEVPWYNSTPPTQQDLDDLEKKILADEASNQNKITTSTLSTTPKSYLDRLNDSYGILDLTEGAWNKLKHIPESLYKATSFGQLEGMTDELDRLQKLSPEQKAADDIEHKKNSEKYFSDLYKFTHPSTLGEYGSTGLGLAEAGVTALDPTGIASSVIPMGRSMYSDIENKDWGGLAGDVTAGIAAPYLLHKALNVSSGNKPKIVPSVEPPKGEFPWGSYSPVDYERIVNDRKNLPGVGEFSPYPRNRTPGTPQLPEKGQTYSPTDPRFYQGRAGVVDINDNPQIDWTDPTVIDSLSGESGQVNPAIPMDVAERGYPGLGRLSNSVRFNPDVNIISDYIDESPDIRTQNAGVIRPSDKFTESINESPTPRKKPGTNAVIGTRVQDRLLYQNEPASLPYGTVNQSGYGVTPRPFRLIPYADTPFPTEAGLTEPIVGEQPFELGSRETSFPQGEPRPVRAPGKNKYRITGEPGEPNNIRLDEMLPSAEKTPKITRASKATKFKYGDEFLTREEIAARKLADKSLAVTKPIEPTPTLPKVEPVTTTPPKVEPVTLPTEKTLPKVEPPKSGVFSRTRQAVSKSLGLTSGVDTELSRLGAAGKKIAKLLGDAKTEARRFAGEYTPTIRAIERSLNKSEKAELGKAFTGEVDPSKLSPKVKDAYDRLSKATSELESKAGKGSLKFDTSVGDESVKDLNSLRQYQGNLAREITHTERFTKLNELIESSSDPKRAKALVDHALGRNTSSLDKSLQDKMYEKVSGAEAGMHLQQFGITNMGDLADFPGVFGLKNTARAIAETAASPHKSVDFSTRTGAQEVLHSGEASDLGSKFNKLTGGKAVEKFNRTVGSKAGRYAVQDFFKKAKNNPGKYADRLARFVDGDVNEVLKQDKLTEKQLDFASNRGTELTSGTPDRLTLPRGFNPKNSLLKIPTLYKRFAFLKLKNIKSTLEAQPTMAGKIAKLSAIAGVNLAAGEAIGDTKKLISGLVTGNVEDKIKNRGDYIGTDSPILDRIIADALQASLFGIVGDVAESATSSKRNKVSGFIGGPVVSDADEFANALASMKENKSGNRNFTPMAKFIGKRLPIPFIGGSFGDLFENDDKPKRKSLSGF